MIKLWTYIKSFTPLVALWTLLDTTMDWLLWGLGKLFRLLRPLVPPLLFVARLLRLNRILNWEDLVLISSSYWNGENRNKAYWLLFGTLFCMVANAKLAYYFGVELKELNDIVNDHGLDSAFYWSVARLAGIGVFWALFNNAYGTIRTYLAIDWRYWMSQMYMRQYVKNEAYLRIKIENADQRLAQDPDVFANTTVWLSMILVETAVNLWTFAPVLYQNSKLLTGICIGCALASYVAVLWLGRSLPKNTYQQYDSEASLRTHLQDGTRYGPSIALQRSERIFLAQAIGRLTAVKQVLVRVMRINLFIGIYNFFADKVVNNAALVGIGWLVMHGRATMGAIAQASQAFTNVYGGLTVFTSQYGAYSTLKAEIERLGPAARALQEIGENRMPQGHWVEYGETDGNIIVFDQVTVLSSYLDSKPVVKEMRFAFDADTLITGRDGHGKTDLARAIGLGVSAGAGKITRPARNKLMFLTQLPYLPICTLREFLSDMQPTTPEDETRFETALDLVGLRDLVERSKSETSSGWDTQQDWKLKISGPEQQQLLLARAILFKPSVLIIDQATDGLEPEVEEDIYKVLRGLGIRLITLSNSSRLAKSFKIALELKEDGSFERHDGPEYKTPGWKVRRFGRGGKDA